MSEIGLPRHTRQAAELRYGAVVESSRSRIIKRQCTAPKSRANELHGGDVAGSFALETDEVDIER